GDIQKVAGVLHLVFGFLLSHLVLVPLFLARPPDQLLFPLLSLRFVLLPVLPRRLLRSASPYLSSPAHPRPPLCGVLPSTRGAASPARMLGGGAGGARGGGPWPRGRAACPPRRSAAIPGAACPAGGRGDGRDWRPSGRLRPCAGSRDPTTRACTAG